MLPSAARKTINLFSYRAKGININFPNNEKAPLLEIAQWQKLCYNYLLKKRKIKI